MANKTILLVFLSFLLFVGMASATDVTSCGGNLADDNFLLQNDVSQTNPNGFTCISLTGDTAEFDGNSHLIHSLAAHSLVTDAFMSSVVIYDLIVDSVMDVQTSTASLSNVAFNVSGFYDPITDNSFISLFWDSNTPYTPYTDMQILQMRVFSKNWSVQFSSQIQDTMYFNGASPDVRYLFYVGNKETEVGVVSGSPMDKPATITFYDRNLTNITILKDGVECPANVCTFVSYIDNDYTFSVVNWSNYSITGQTPPVVVPPVVVNGSSGNITFYFAITPNQTALDNGIFVYPTSYVVDTETYPELNVSATLVFDNITFSNPLILHNGVECSPLICTNLSYVGNVFRFDVTGWSNYTIIETPIPAELLNTTLSIIFNSPTEGEEITTNFPFNASIYGNNITIANATLYINYSNGTFLQQEFATINSSNSVNVSFDVTLLEGNYSALFEACGFNSTSTICDTDGYINFYIPAEVVPEPEVVPSTQTPLGLFQVMAESGAGLGLFILAMAKAIPLLLIPLALVAIVIIIGGSIAKVITHSRYLKK